MKKLTIEFNNQVKMWEAVKEYADGSTVTYMDVDLPRLAETVPNEIIEPAGFMAK